jgi:hypothetical protein
MRQPVMAKQPAKVSIVALMEPRLAQKKHSVYIEKTLKNSRNLKETAMG